MIREPSVAGQFYPASAAALKGQLDGLIEQNQNKEEALGLVVPHAGYIYSGRVAGSGFSQVKLTSTVVILSPNHTGSGEPFSIMTQGTWQMPLGDVEVDSVLAKEFLKQSKYLREDAQAHADEHSIEVQIPFLQYLLPEIKIVPIVFSTADAKVYDEIGRAIAKGLKNTGRTSLIVASSDMTHYEPQEQAKAKDELAIEAILKLDQGQLIKRINKFNITMCGYGPVICMLSATKALGAKHARLVKYETSGDTSGDYSSVVGYAAILVK